LLQEAKFFGEVEIDERKKEYVAKIIYPLKKQVAFS